MSSELTSWQVCKFKSLFDLFDSNGNGTTDESELEGAMERLQLDTGWPENSRVLSHVKARWKVVLSCVFRDSPILSEKKWLDFLGKFLEQDRERRAEDPNHRGGLEEL